MTTKCNWCGKETINVATELCDNHWELYRRISWEPEMAQRMLEQVRKEDEASEQYWQSNTQGE